MLITPIQLEREPLELDENLPAEAIEYLPGIRQIGPIPVKGGADLIVEHRGPKELVYDIRLRAAWHGRFELACARCIQPMEQKLKGEFDLIFRPAGVDAATGERAITTDETEIGYYQQSGLLLEDVLREQVLLSLPDRILCKPDCKGLCPRCGQDLNLADCSCGNAPADPRWNALAGLADRIKK